VYADIYTVRPIRVGEWQSNRGEGSPPFILGSRMGSGISQRPAADNTKIAH